MVQPISDSSVQPFLDQLNKFQKTGVPITKLFLRKIKNQLILEEKTIFSSMRKVIYRGQYDSTRNIEAVADLLDREDVQPQQKEQIKTLINGLAESLIKSYASQVTRSTKSVFTRIFISTSKLVEKLNKTIAILIKIGSEQESTNKKTPSLLEPARSDLSADDETDECIQLRKLEEEIEQNEITLKKPILPRYPLCSDYFSYIIEELNLGRSFLIYNDLSEYSKDLEVIESILESFRELESKFESVPQSSANDLRSSTLQKIKEMYISALNDSLKCVAVDSSWKSIKIMESVNDQAIQFIKRMQNKLSS